MRTTLHWATLAVLTCFTHVVWASVSLTVSSAATGSTITGSTMTIGTGNGLGVGTPSAGISVLTAGVTGGVLYASPYNVNVTVTGPDKNQPITVTAAVTANFTNLTLLNAESCLPGTCSSGSNFVAVPAAGSVTVVPATSITGSGPSFTRTFTPSIAVFVSNANGAAAYSGPDQVTITLVATDATSGNTASATLTLQVSVQNAVQFTLATASGGLAISPAADFLIDFGSVNGLGVGTPLAGLTKNPLANGVIYATPYLIQPRFSDFTSSTGSVYAYVSSDFANPNTVSLQDATAVSGPFAAIGKSSATANTITNTAASGSTTTRYLGLFVSSANGPGAFPGSGASSGTDTATLTFTLTVP